jgi:hypothetical protein
MNQVFVGIIAEGTTDYRFLEPVILKSMTDIVYECTGQIDVNIRIIECEKGVNFPSFVVNASKIGHQDFGISVLIVHADADNLTAKETYANKINPALDAIKKESELTHCKNIVALVPVYETESWMLADKSILIKQIGTFKTDVDLRLNGNPERFKNPKERIEEAIRIGRQDMPKKMKESLKLNDLYSYLGQAIQLVDLRKFESFLDFETNIRNVLVDMKLLHSK